MARRAGEPPILSDEALSAMIGDQIVRADIPDPTKSDPAQLSPDSVNGAVYYAPFPLSISVDGEASDWENVPRATIDSGPLLPSDHDTSMTFAVAADNLNLYFLADVVDSAVVYGLHEPVVAWYEEDSVEFYINATGDPNLTQYEAGIVQLGIMAANLTQPETPIVGGYNSDTVPMTVVVVETDTGYRVEASVPLITDVWTIEPAHLAEIGFQAHLNGSSSTDRDTKLIWSIYDTRDQSWTNPSLFGSLIFWNTEE